jgi:hypothetical protein
MPTPLPSPVFGDADIPILMADVGVPVTVGGVAGRGIVDWAGEIIVQDAQRGEVIATVTTISVQTSAFPNAKGGDAVVLNSRNFTVRERLPEGDGGLTKLLLGV